MVELYRWQPGGGRGFPLPLSIQGILSAALDFQQKNITGGGEQGYLLTGYTAWTAWSLWGVCRTIPCP